MGSDLNPSDFIKEDLWDLKRKVEKAWAVPLDEKVIKEFGKVVAEKEKWKGFNVVSNSLRKKIEVFKALKDVEVLLKGEK